MFNSLLVEDGELINPLNDLLQRLWMVNSIEQLGIDRNLKKEIKSTLDYVYRSVPITFSSFFIYALYGIHRSVPTTLQNTNPNPVPGSNPNPNPVFGGATELGLARWIWCVGSPLYCSGFTSFRRATVQSRLWIFWRTCGWLLMRRTSNGFFSNGSNLTATPFPHKTWEALRDRLLKTLRRLLKTGDLLSTRPRFQIHWDDNNTITIIRRRLEKH